ALRTARAGTSVVVSATAPRRSYRERVRAQHPAFIEVFVSAPDEVRRERDPKGLYRAASRGEVTALPGAGSVYEAPTAAEVVIDTSTEPVESSVTRILASAKAVTARR